MKSATVTSMAQLSYLELLLLFLLPISSWSECIPNPNERTRSAEYMACSEGWVNYQGITQTRQVPSVSYCGSLCLSDAFCNSFNVLQNTSGDYQCQLSAYQVTNCSTLTAHLGARSYAVKQEVYKCSDQWRVALKTDGSKVVKGSLDDLRKAVLAAAKITVLQEPYPQPASLALNSGHLYVPDTLRVQEALPQVTGYIYTYISSLYASPMWAHITVDTSGALETFMSNGSSSVSSSNSLTWMVQGVTSKCFQSQPLSHNDAVRSPALTVDVVWKSGEVSDIMSVLNRGGTMSVVSFMGDTGMFSYPTYALVMYDPSTDGLYSKSTWIPGTGTGYIPLRMHEFNFNFDFPYFETFLEFDSGSDITSHIFRADPALTKTEVYLDPCWEFKLSIDPNGYALEGSKEELFSAVRTGARLTFLVEREHRVDAYEAEKIHLNDDNYIMAHSKMGVLSDEGYDWLDGFVTTYGSYYIGPTPVIDSKAIKFFTDTRHRPFKYSVIEGKEVEGTWVETRARLQAGLIPRVELFDPGKELYLEVEHVRIGYMPWEVSVQCYRVPEENGFTVYFLQLDGSYRVDVGLYRSHGDNREWRDTYGFTLYFEDWPLDSE